MCIMDIFFPLVWKKQMLWKKNGSKSILKIKMKAGTQGLIFDVIKCC